MTDDDDRTHLEHAAALLQAASDYRNGIDVLPFYMYVVGDDIVADALADAGGDEGDGEPGDDASC